jgi:hypothetical protein
MCAAGCWYETCLGEVGDKLRLIVLIMCVLDSPCPDHGRLKGCRLVAATLWLRHLVADLRQSALHSVMPYLKSAVSTLRCCAEAFPSLAWSSDGSMAILIYVQERGRSCSYVFSYVLTGLDLATQ